MGKSIPLTYKIVAYVIAWLGALFATNPSAKYWPLAYLFPLGLPAFFSRYWANTGGWAVMASSVGMYLVHGWFYFRSRKPGWTLSLFGMLVALLVCNVSGCRAMLPAH